jgi:hypothetical protein
VEDSEDCFKMKKKKGLERDEEWIVVCWMKVVVVVDELS